jgi:hypothetical protein
MARRESARIGARDLPGAAGTALGDQRRDGSHRGRISGSLAVYESADFDTAILTADGRGLFVGVYVIRQASALDLVVQAVLERFSEDIQDGDVFLTSHPCYGARSTPWTPRWWLRCFGKESASSELRTAHLARGVRLRDDWRGPADGDGSVRLEIARRLVVRDTPSGPVLGCRRCGRAFGPATEDPRRRALMIEVSLSDLSPLNADGLEDQVVVRESCCPARGMMFSTGVHLRSEDPAAPEMQALEALPEEGLASLDHPRAH